MRINIEVKTAKRAGILQITLPSRAPESRKAWSFNYERGKNYLCLGLGLIGFHAWTWKPRRKNVALGVPRRSVVVGVGADCESTVNLYPPADDADPIAS